MQQPDILRIKKLIQTSPLLNSGERQEWIMLLELMNDKQLWELERILASTVKVEEPLEISPLLKTGDKGDKVMEIPPLTHIMNAQKIQAVFPQSSPFAVSRQIPPATSAIAKDTIFAASGNRSQGFWQKIKDVLKEKELPPGHPEPAAELELPAPASAYSPQLNQTNIGHKAKPVAPLPKSPLVPAKTALVEPKIQDRPKEILKKIRDQKIEEDKLFVPGITDTHVLMEAKFAKEPSKQLLPELVKEQEPSVLQKKDASPPVLGKTLILNKLEEVGKLKMGAIGSIPTASLADQLKGFVKKFGYHQVIFALEKSPAYLTYLNTGMASLAGKYDLETGEYKIKTLEKFLNKSEFEKFVDVLRAIKSN